MTDMADRGLVPNGNDNDENSGTSRQPRDRLPVPQPSKTASNLWSFLKNCIGKELSKITMPVEWNEPLSLLQRLTENMNYAVNLQIAADQPDPELRMLFVSTFAVSSLASNHLRMGKPFNPLLGETYELTRDNFRMVTEQVGHHPPVSAFYAENVNNDFILHGSVYPKVKFWGKSVEFQPKGTCTLRFPKHDNETYTWNPVNCVVHNIIVGSLWMEQQGVMEIVNHQTGLKSVLSFKAGGWFPGSDDLNIVEGFVIDRNKKKLKFIYGKWSEFLCAVGIAQMEEFLKVKADKIDASASNLPKHAPLTMCEIPGSMALWNADPRPEYSASFYNFSLFTMGLNESPNTSEKLCPSDSRLRPDIRALENGDLNVASSEKERLENKQREYRKPFKGKKESEWWKPRWFGLAKNPVTKEEDWEFGGKYWDRNYSEVPDIF